jgi:DNA-3-methyladenine glycosylase II
MSDVATAPATRVETGPRSASTPPPDFTIAPLGPFSLRELATFGFGQRLAPTFDGVMRLAFCVDGYDAQVGVEVRQDDAGVHGRVQGSADAAVVKAQVARVLSLDHDGRALEAIGRRDPVVARLLAAAPGLRPPLFYSPYEAAAWAVLSARRPAGQMADVRRRLSEAHGRSFEVAGQTLASLPTPEQLLAVAEWPGLPEVKIRRLHGVAVAAIEGRLDAGRLRAMETDEARTALCRLAGIGPFWADLILIRASGHADLLPSGEPRLNGLLAELYHLPGPPDPDDLIAMGEAWRPLRTWVAVLVRAAARRVTSGEGV